MAALSLKLLPLYFFRRRHDDILLLILSALPVGSHKTSWGKMPKPILSVADTEECLEEYTPATARVVRANTDVIYHQLVRGKMPRQGGNAGLTLIIGPTGAGKSTLACKLLQQQEYQSHSVLIDNDAVRSAMEPYRNDLAAAINSGMDPAQADRRTFDKWRAASVYIVRSLINKAHEEGYDILLSNMPDSVIANEICASTRESGLPLTTMIVHAPLAVAQESIRKRIKAGGHHARPEHLVRSYTDIKPMLAELLASGRVEYHWRERHDIPPALVAERNPSEEWKLHDPAGSAAMEKLIDAARPGMTLSELEKALPEKRKGARSGGRG